MNATASLLLASALVYSLAGNAMAQNDRFTQGGSDSSWTDNVPYGWEIGGNVEFRYGTIWGGVPDSKRAATLTSVRKLTESDFGTLMQTISADAFRGRHIRLSALVSAERSLASGRIALWMRVNDASGKVSAFDDMATRPIPAGTSWERHEIVLDVPNAAASITFGILLAGKEKGCCWGRLAVSDFRLDVVGEDVAVTGKTDSGLPIAPVNTDFRLKN